MQHLRLNLRAAPKNPKKVLTVFLFCGKLYTPLKGGFIFVPAFLCLACVRDMVREANMSKINWRCQHESQDNIGMHGVQTTQLQHHEKQKEHT